LCFSFIDITEFSFYFQSSLLLAILNKMGLIAAYKNVHFLVVLASS
jgi:hypothetical protein